MHGAGAPFEHWPLAARFINEKLRQKQVGKEQRTPPFLSKVLVRKRYWRMKELEPTQEQVLYLCPSWVHHGHRVERPHGTQTLTKIRPDGTQTLTKMVMHGRSEPPTLETWEDALNPIEERRRLRHKASIYKIEAGEGEGGSEPEGVRAEVENAEVLEQETSQLRRKEKVRRLIEEEMVEAMDDDQQVAGMVFDGR